MSATRWFAVFTTSALALVAACNALSGADDLNVGDCTSCDVDAATDTGRDDVAVALGDAGADVTATLTCPPGQEICAGVCVARNVDNANCGTCGHVCQAATACAGGQCIASCDGGVVCGAACVDPKTDTQHCGTCATACGASQTCGGGTCVVGLTVNAARPLGSASTVTSAPAGLSCPGACQLSSLPNATVTLTTHAAPDEVFVEWTGACTGRAPTCVLTMNGPKTVSATFAKLANFFISQDRLFSADSATGSTTLIGALGAPCPTNIADIAIDRRGNAYLVGGGQQSQLFSLNLTAATCGAAIGVSQARCLGIAFAPSLVDPTADVLLCGTSTGTLESVDVATGAHTLIGSFGLAASNGDLQFIPGQGLFVSQTTGIYRVDQASGATTLVGNPALTLLGMGRHGSNLVACTTTGIYAVDTTTGAATPLNAALTFACHGGASWP